MFIGFSFCEMPVCAGIFPLQIEALLFSDSVPGGSPVQGWGRRLQCPQASVLVCPMGDPHQEIRARKKGVWGYPGSLCPGWLQVGWHSPLRDITPARWLSHSQQLFSYFASSGILESILWGYEDILLYLLKALQFYIWHLGFKIRPELILCMI